MCIRDSPQTERDRLLRFFPALAAFTVVPGEDAAALRAGIGCFLLFHKALQALALIHIFENFKADYIKVFGE